MIFLNKHIFILMLMLMPGMCSYGAAFRFQHVTVQDGLLENTITAICQDNMGFIWLGSPNGLSRYDSKEFKHYKHSPANSATLSSDYVTALFCDSRGTLWVGTRNGLNRYYPISDSFAHFFCDEKDQASLSSNNIYTIYEDAESRLWIGTASGLNCLYEKKTPARITRFRNNSKARQKEAPGIWDICADRSGTLWLATSQGLACVRNLEKNKPSYVFFYNDEGGSAISDNLVYTVCADDHNQIWTGNQTGMLSRFDPLTGKYFRCLPRNLDLLRKITLGPDGNLWIGTNEGLFLFDILSGGYTKFRSDPLDPGSISNDAVFSQFFDRQGTLWLGGYYSGLSCTYGATGEFRPLVGKTAGKITGLRIAGGNAGTVWVAQSNGALIRIDTETGVETFYKGPFEKIKALYDDKEGKLWIAENAAHLAYLDYKKNTWKKFHIPVPGRPEEGIAFIMEDARDQLLIGTTQNGIYQVDKKTAESHIYRCAKGAIADTRNIRLNAVPACLDSKQNLWLSTREGVSLFQHASLTPTDFRTIASGYESSRKGNVICIREDGKGRIWLGTFNDGLKYYDVNQRRFMAAGPLMHFRDKSIDNIETDKTGNLWFSNEYGLVRYNPDRMTVQQYTEADGIPGNEILANLSYKDQRGGIFFSTNNAVFRLDPDEFPVNYYAPSLIFTSLSLFNKPVAVGDSTGLLDCEITLTRKITFNHAQTVFTLGFAMLNFVWPSKKRYAYRLEGFEKDWNYVSQPTCTYTNLSPGKYVLFIKGANSDGIWSATSRLDIVVLPPWWATWMAYTVYILIGITMIALIMFAVMRSHEKQREIQLHLTKLDFFTNISHEIRTHLNLISGPLELLLSKKQEKVFEVESLLKNAKRNSDLLLSQVNEMLDFRKLENGSTRLRVSENDIVPFLQNIISAFEHLSIQRNIETRFFSDKDQLCLWFDPFQLRKVIYNILANAYKFSNNGGRIGIEVHDGSEIVFIKFIDNGQGIKPENINKLFDHFFQAPNNDHTQHGYGIGLAISKAVMDLHMGGIAVSSTSMEQARKTCFTLSLKKGMGHFNKGDIIERDEVYRDLSLMPEPACVQQTSARELDTILLVEDNEAFRTLVMKFLSVNFNVIEASDGKDGWMAVMEHLPHLVISDVMMAGMNGVMLCDKIKTDLKTSHIPVILLTAKADDASQLYGLQSGADVYITKPFSLHILEQNINNLLRNRNLIQQKYSQQILQESCDVVDDKEAVFLNGLARYIESHLEDPTLNVSRLSLHVNMSVSVLYKKLRALTNMTVNEFIRSIRLKKAAQLLIDGDLQVGEVANMVGYEDRKYFSAEFKKQYGLAPRDYVAETKKTREK